MKPRVHAQSGQLILEAVILMTVLISIVFIVANYFTNTEVLKNLIGGPWQSLSGMMQNGEWGPPNATDAIHPNAHYRHVVILGEHVQ